MVWAHNIQLSLIIFCIVLWVRESSWNSISIGRILVPSLCASQRVTCSDSSRAWTLDRTVNCLHRRNLQITACWTSGSISDPLQQRHTSAMHLPAVWVGRWTDSEFQIVSVHLSLTSTSWSTGWNSQTKRDSWCLPVDQIKSVDYNYIFFPKLWICHCWSCTHTLRHKWRVLCGFVNIICV